MGSKYCSNCIQKLPLSCFLKDTLTGPTSRVYSTCIQCRDKGKKASNKKRAALRSVDPNIQPAKRVYCPNTGLQPIIQAPLPLYPPIEPPPPNPPIYRSNTGPQPVIQAPLPLNPPIELPPNPPTEPQPPQAPVTVLPPAEPTGFLPTDEWQWIQDFNRAMEAVQLETCQRCQERGFSMDLTDSVCHQCFLRDTDNRKRPVTPFLMSADNHMDPGVVPSHLLELT
jgi:hypothetical protein